MLLFVDRSDKINQSLAGGRQTQGNLSEPNRLKQVCSLNTDPLTANVDLVVHSLSSYDIVGVGLVPTLTCE